MLPRRRAAELKMLCIMQMSIVMLKLLALVDRYHNIRSRRRAARSGIETSHPWTRAQNFALQPGLSP